LKVHASGLVVQCFDGSVVSDEWFSDLVAENVPHGGIRFKLKTKFRRKRRFWSKLSHNPPGFRESWGICSPPCGGFGV